MAEPAVAASNNIPSSNAYVHIESARRKNKWMFKLY